MKKREIKAEHDRLVLHVSRLELANLKLEKARDEAYACVRAADARVLEIERQRDDLNTKIESLESAIKGAIMEADQRDAELARVRRDESGDICLCGAVRSNHCAYGGDIKHPFGLATFTVSDPPEVVGV